MEISPIYQAISTEVRGIAPGWISTTLKIDEGVRGRLGEPAWTRQGARKRGFPGVVSPFCDRRVMESGM